MQINDLNLINGDCLELMSKIETGSIDMILCDLPYGTLNKNNKMARWDSPIDLELLWKEYNRIIKPNGAILLFGMGAFTADLINSNRKMFKYTLVWDKVQKTGFLNAKRMPLRQHEDIVVFYKNLPTYNPQMQKCEPGKENHSKGKLGKRSTNNCYGNYYDMPTIVSDKKYPTSIISVPKEHKKGHFYHPTQKPVALLEYLIKTYTNADEVVLDNCMGAGSAGIACINTGRRFIGMEISEKYFDIASARIREAVREHNGNL